MPLETPSYTKYPIVQGDGISLGDSTYIIANAYLFNGTNYDRERSNISGTAFASAARTSDQSLDLVNYNHNGVIITLNVTAVTATPSITLRIRLKDPASGKYENMNAAPTAVTAIGTHTYVLYPGAGAAAGDIVQSTSFPLPRDWNIFIDHLDADSITYSVGYQLIKV